MLLQIYCPKICGFLILRVNINMMNVHYMFVSLCSAAYEPPPDILFTPPVEREVLTASNRRFFSNYHNLKLRVSQDYWTKENQGHTLHVCLCAAMHYSQTFPQVYSVLNISQYSGMTHTYM